MQEYNRTPVTKFWKNSTRLFYVSGRHKVKS